MHAIRLLDFVLALLCFLPVVAEEVTDFSRENDSFEGVNLRYAKAEINPLYSSRSLVVIYLHGGSGQGEDNEAQLQSQAVDEICTFLNEGEYHAYFLVPQIPEGQQWEGRILAALKALAEKYTHSENAECYILGSSMGGYGVWNLLAEYPDYFAGAMPVACNTPRQPAEDYAGTRIFSVVGGQDFRRNISAIRSFFSHLEASSSKGARLDIERDWNHRETCEWSFTPERLDWLFNSNMTAE